MIRVAATEQLGIAPADIDADYGLITLDLERGTYAIRVRADRVAQAPGNSDRGPFSDPRISTFGPGIEK